MAYTKYVNTTYYGLSTDVKPTTARKGDTFYESNTKNSFVFDGVSTWNTINKGEAASVDVGNTSTGVPGSAASVTNSGDTTNAILNFNIPAGAVIHSTVVIPNNSVGVDGDWAFSTAVGSEVYFKSSGAWALVNSNRGATGATGPQGPQGIQGVAGANGANGTNGIDGTGTVNSVSVVTANGVSGSVATATTTPEISLTLGAITPSTVNGVTLSGSSTPTLAVTGTTTVSGTNTGDNTVATALTGTPSITVATATTTGDIELGHASDTTIHRVSAGLVSIEGNNVLTVATGLPLAGGTMTGKIVSSGSSEVGKTYIPATGSQTVALDCALNNMHIVSGNASGTAITFTIANAVNSQPFIVSIRQGGTTVSTIAAWFATIRWAGGITPTLTATLNKRDTFGFIRTGANTYDGFVVGQNA